MAATVQLMAHMGAPHTFIATNASYSTAFVLDMLVLAATFKIEVGAQRRAMDGCGWIYH